MSEPLFSTGQTALLNVRPARWKAITAQRLVTVALSRNGYLAVPGLTRALLIEAHRARGVEGGMAYEALPGPELCDAEGREAWAGFARDRAAELIDREVKRLRRLERGSAAFFAEAVRLGALWKADADLMAVLDRQGGGQA